jgi:esterase/lipase superfamily enzyme
MLRNKGTGHVLVFIHGYNNRFEDAVFSYAQFVHDSGAPVIPTLFTWPSRGQLLGYGYDRESANYSRDALEEILRRLDRNPAVTQITVMAHSMGNGLALETLSQMEIRSGRLPSKIDTVIMAAPDVDVDVFRTQMKSLMNAGPQYILLASQDDLALSVSRRVWGSSVRLGAVDAAAEPYRSELEAAGLMVVDLTEAEGGGLNHAKYASVPGIAKVLGERLAAGHTLGVPKATLGDRIGLATASGAAAVGGAVGLVVTAPLAVIDADERDRFGDRVSAVGDDAKSGLGITTAPKCPTDRFAPRPIGCPEL